MDTYVDYGDEEQLTVRAYKRNILYLVVIVCLCVFSLGILALIFYWKPSWFLKATSNTCSLSKASHLLLKDKWGDEWVEVVIEEALKKSAKRSSNEDPFALEHSSKWRYFEHRKLKYIWDYKEKTFSHFKMPLLKCSYFHNKEGLDDLEAADRLRFYGANMIDVAVTPIIVLLITQALNPFYIFQLFSVLVWMFGENAYYFSSCVMIMSFISLAASVYQINSTEKNLKKTMTAVDMISVKRNKENNYRTVSEFTEISSRNLVPGDIILISATGCVMHCDAVLISGSVVVNESTLTGESTPVSKICINPTEEIFVEKYNTKSVLYCGTTVLKTRSHHNVLALVIRTGFQTNKGSLVRSIMYPKSIDYKFTNDSYKFIAGLFVIGVLGSSFSFIAMESVDSSAGAVIIRIIDLITTAVPPILPAAMTFCIAVSQSRLRRDKIFCINSKSIILGGSIDTFCFDKTGTLTEEGLDLNCVHPVSNAKYEEVLYMKTDKLDTFYSQFLLTMATCHSISIVDNNLNGDNIDLKLFEFTEWSFMDEKNQSINAYATVRSNETQEIYGLMKEFPFSSALQRMSVLVVKKYDADSIISCVKGSPEMIRSLCLPHTIPEDFDKVLIQYTEQGFRTLALACKRFKIENEQEIVNKISIIEREEAENDLELLGLVVFENKLKPQSPSIIQKLNNASFKTVMITGDNLLTALTVAQKCNFVNKPIYLASIKTEDNKNEPLLCRVPELSGNAIKKKSFNLSSLEFGDVGQYHLAITGNTWKFYNTHFPHLINKVIINGVVFARFSPDQKQQLVERIQLFGYKAGMCGDGANDCGALKAAQTGIALSDTEASVSAPFSSKKHDISCVDILIREGRSTLTNSYGLFKVIIFYSLNLYIYVTFHTWICTIPLKIVKQNTMFELGLFSTKLFDSVVNHHQVKHQVNHHLKTYGQNDAIPDIFIPNERIFLYFDILILFPIFITFCLTRRNEELVQRKPPESLIALAPIMSMIISLLLSIATFTFISHNVTLQPWFPSKPREYILTSLFLVATTQDVTMGLLYVRGRPFQKAVITNFWFILAVIVTSFVNYLTILASNHWWNGILRIEKIPSFSYRLLVVGVTVVHFILAYFIEKVLIERLVETKIQPWLAQKLFANKFENKKEKLIIDASFENWALEDMSFEKFMAREIEIEKTTIRNDSLDDSNIYDNDKNNLVVYNNRGFNNQPINVDST